MQEKLKALFDLQKIDTRLIKIEKSKEGLPEIVLDTEKRIEKKKIYLEKIKTEITEIETLLQDDDKRILKSNEMLEEYKVKRDNVTNNKEYEALANEMAFHENLVEELNENCLSLNKQLDSGRGDLEEAQTAITELEKQLEASKEKLATKLTETDKDEKALIAKRETITVKIPKRLYNLYYRILKSKAGKAVVGGDKGFCEGCYTVLPSQKTSELKRGDVMVQCDACSRILTFGLKDSE